MKTWHLLSKEVCPRSALRDAVRRGAVRRELLGALPVREQLVVRRRHGPLRVRRGLDGRRLQPALPARHLRRGLHAAVPRVQPWSVSTLSTALICWTMAVLRSRCESDNFVP